MSEFGEGSPSCWKPARATGAIPPGRSDHESHRAAGRAYRGPALTTYQRSTSAVHNYWLSANNNSLHVTGAQVARVAPQSVPKEAIQDHIILGTDNYYTSPRTKWDQFIGERPPRTRGIPGYTGIQPRPEQVRGTPDHTQGKVKASAPDLAQTHCRYVPPYAALATQTIPAVYANSGYLPTSTQYSSRPHTAAASTAHHASTIGAELPPTQFSPRPNIAAEATLATSPSRVPHNIPRLNVAAIDSTHSHAGKGPCLLACQQTARPDFGGSIESSQPAQERLTGGSPMPDRSVRSNGLYTGQAGLQPMTAHARCTQRPNTAVSYHTSGAATWRGPCVQPINIGTSRNRGNECYGGVRNSGNGLPPFALQTSYHRGW